jgi:hypothetical protein
MRDYGTLEDKRALFDLVLAKMTEGDGMSMTKACRSFDVCPSTFLFWIETDQLQDTSCAERYRRAQKISCLLEADSIVQTVVNACDDPRTNEFGIDKGFVELEKLRANMRQWRLNGRTRMFLDKQEDVDSDSKATGSISIVFEEAKP